jgi:esterase/lipase superfamily enzyme
VPPAGAAAPDGSAVVSVFYATDRERLAGPTLNYGPARNRTGALDLGRFDVSVPRDHERGTLERPDIWTFWREDPAKHFLITGRTRQSYDAFYGDIRDRIARAERKDAFVFVHGFNVAFEDAVYRTAQFAYDLQVPIAPILYSWPSAATLSPIGYSTDAESNRWTERHLRWFLEDVLARTGAERVHLVAHSMGNKALVNALDMMGPSTTRKFGQIILTAPDIDADQFVQLAAAIRRSGERATLYASANDIALSASKRLQGGYRRAGDASGGVVVVPGIDTIDVSVLKTDFLGHSPQGNGSVISDIFLLLTQGLGPGSRPGLRRAGTAPALFWRFVP